MPSLDLHPASPEERLAAYRNVHDVWGGGLTLEQHVERRLASVQHNRADWYVGRLDDRVVASLAAYPLEFHLRGDVVPGFSIGSVHTLADYRGRGFAAELIAYVEATRRAQEARIALLYSDIACGYYARLGYVECPAWWGSRRAEKDDGAAAWRLAACSPEQSLEALQRMYRDFHARHPIAVARNVDYWRHTLEKGAGDEFLWVVDAANERRGYVRLRRIDSAVRILDFAFAADCVDGPDAEANRETLLRKVLDHAARQGAERVEGWFPDWPAAQNLFSLRPREQEITMLKSLDENIVLDDTLIACTHWFCEIDHV
ncbi:MAG: GNAT family N-acetyltransferase [Pirellulaceae bacterium]